MFSWCQQLKQTEEQRSYIYLSRLRGGKTAIEEPAWNQHMLSHID
jgi:hypothetical protein